MINFFEISSQTSGPQIQSFDPYIYGDPQTLSQLLSRHAGDTAVVKISGKLGVEGVWPDSIGCWADEGRVVFSRRIIDAIKDNGLRGYEIMPVHLIGPSLKKIRIAPPEYFWLIPLGGPLQMRTHYYRLIQEPDTARKVRYEYSFTSDAPDAPAAVDDCISILDPIAETWDGSDFIPWRPNTLFGGYGAFNCSRRFAELLYTNGWVNVVASPICHMGMTRSAAGMPRKPWPPEPWYGPKETGRILDYPFPPGATGLDDAAKHFIYRT